MRTVRGLDGGAGLGVGLRDHAARLGAAESGGTWAGCLRSGVFRDRLSGAGSLDAARYGTVHVAAADSLRGGTILWLSHAQGGR
ncbi:hypothetical protein SY2F82_60880 [Streptomyces sp. Y2F8-2]|nr:hypothetical protein SY2F82_60880 [Streptomyces sp. Y2F8-2]